MSKKKYKPLIKSTSPTLNKMMKSPYLYITEQSTLPPSLSSLLPLLIATYAITLVLGYKHPKTPPKRQGKPPRPL